MVVVQLTPNREQPTRCYRSWQRAQNDLWLDSSTRLDRANFPIDDPVDLDASLSAAR